MFRLNTTGKGFHIAGFGHNGMILDRIPTGYRRLFKSVWIVSLFLLAGWFLVSKTAYAQSPLAVNTPAPEISNDVNYGVVKLHYPDTPPTGQGPFILIRDEDVIMEVKNPERWFGQLFVRSGKPDPRMQVTLPDDVKKLREAAARLPADSPERKEAIAKEMYWRDFALSEQYKRWLEQSCFFVVEGRRFIDLHPLVVGAFPYTIWNADAEHHDNFWWLRFHPTITDENKSNWMTLLGGQGFTPRPVQVTLGQSNAGGLDSTDEIPTELSPEKPKEEQVDLQIASPMETTWGFIVVGLLLAVFSLLATRTALLKDLDPDDELWHVSLGRSQMAFWFLLIVISYVFLWIVTGDYATITQSELVLFGISATTALGASLMSTSDTEYAPRASKVLSEDDIKASASDLGSRIEQAENDFEKKKDERDKESDSKKKTALGDELKLLERRVKGLKRRQAYLQRSPFNRVAMDLLQEVDRPSLHRLQMIGWTFVLGLVFIDTVYFTLAMPNFDTTLLALMGISNGTYLGFKFNARPDTTP